MANKPRGFGLTAELQKKKEGKFNAEMANQAIDWVMAVLEYSNPSDPDLGRSTWKEVEKMDAVQDLLKDGVILCKLMNAMFPNSVKKINTSTMAFKQMENISKFLDCCDKVAGMVKSDLFQTVDLYEGSNIPVVIDCLYSLGRKAHENKNADLPTLGPRESVENKREFTDEQMEAGKNVIGLQMGSNKGASQAGQNFGKTRAIID